MKAITLWQPWASLLACGAKQYETRSWATSYRGPIAIHSGLNQTFFKTEVNSEESYNFILAAQKALIWPGLHKLPRGVIIATAELVGCHEMTESVMEQPCIFKGGEVYIPYGNEYLFGDWATGRYAWEFSNMKMLDEPIPAKGMQGLWNWDEEQYPQIHI